MKTEAAQKKIPWPATATALFTLVACALLNHENWLSILAPSLSGAAVLSSRFSTARLPRKSIAAWGLRILIFALILAALFAGPRLSGVEVLEYWDLFLLFCMAEMGLQCWLLPPPGGMRGESIILFSGLIFMSSTATFKEVFIPWLAPIYCALAALALRGLRPRSQTPGFRAGRFGLSKPLWLASALVLGFLFFVLISANRSVLDNIDVLVANYFWKLNQTTVGFSEYPVLTASALQPTATERVLRLKGSCCPPHLRVLAFDTYAEKGWHVEGGRNFEAAPPAALCSTAPGERLRIIRLNMLGGNLPLPLHAAGLDPLGHPTMWAPQADVALHGDETLGCYEVILNDKPEYQGPLCQPLNKDELRRCLQVPPEVDPRVKELALRIAGNLASPAAQVRAVENYLQKNYAYSLTTDPGPGDPISNFLLKKQAAHCVYFASAAVMLLRSLGLPARYVSGFYAHEPAGAGTLVVRQLDAHAWAECRLADKGWITVDATPSDGLPDAARAQISLWTNLREWLQDSFADLKEWLARQNYLPLLPVLALPVLAVFLWRRLRQWRRKKSAMAPPFAYAAPAPDLAALGADFERHLRRRKLACPVARTWGEHLAQARAGEAAPDLGAAKEFVQKYNRLRFGAAGDAAELACLRDLKEKLLGERLL